jgi:hypothetical protein
MTTDPRALLLAPERYPGLLAREPRARRLHLRVEPVIGPHTSWTIYAAEDSWWVRRVTWHKSEARGLIGPGDTFAAEAQLPSAPIAALDDALTALTLRPFLSDDSIGRDGATFYVERSSRFASCSLGWWCAPPEGWEPLDAWFQQVHDLCEAALPSHS